VCKAVQQSGMENQNRALERVMIDVRTEWEYNEGHIYNAKGPLLVEESTNWEPTVFSWGATKE